MNLSNEDSLRLNVLLNQDIEAIRIDESKMIVHALTPRGEAKVQLNPNCRDEQYIKQVKEVISGHVLGSPGGYPIFLRRWTRMGQANDDSLERLLKLGEPEAVVAVVHAAGLTDELARRAWWAMPSSANARCMLARQAVVEGEMGKPLAEFLVEFLPFEEDPRDMLESVRLVLQPGLIDAATRQDLWSRGQRKNAFLVGFLKAMPDELPETAPAHPALAGLQAPLQALTEAGSDSVSDTGPDAAALARQLLRVLSPAGQAFVHTATTVMKKPANQDVVVALLEAIECYFAGVRPAQPLSKDIDEVLAQANGYFETGLPAPVRALIEAQPDSAELLRAMLRLSMLGVHVVDPIFARTDAIGSVMRRKIEPVSTPALASLAALRGKGA